MNPKIQFVFEAYDQNNEIQEGFAMPTLKEAIAHAKQRTEEEPIWKFSIRREEIE